MNTKIELLEGYIVPVDFGEAGGNGDGEQPPKPQEVVTGKVKPEGGGMEEGASFFVDAYPLFLILVIAVVAAIVKTWLGSKK